MPLGSHRAVLLTPSAYLFIASLFIMIVERAEDVGCDGTSGSNRRCLTSANDKLSLVDRLSTTFFSLCTMKPRRKSRLHLSSAKTFANN